MRRISFALGLLVAVLVVTAAAPAPALAQAQENGTDAGQDAPKGYEERVDEWVILTDWEYTGDRFLLTFESTRTVRVTISEVISREEAEAGTFSLQRRTIDNGTTTVEMPAETGPSGEAAVTITTPRSIQEGSGAFVSTGQQSSNPFSAFGGTQGLLIGITLTCMLALLAACIIFWKESSGVEVAA